jgi:hypothetical protein
VLLIALWVRSFWQVDTVYANIGGMAAFKIESVSGSLILIRNPNGPWGINSQSVSEWRYRRDLLQKFQNNLYQGKKTPPVVSLIATIPHWIPVLLTAVFAAAPWVQRSKRFSLRTLLIATTLVAVVLGLVVYAARVNAHVNASDGQRIE